MSLWHKVGSEYAGAVDDTNIGIQYDIMDMVMAWEMADPIGLYSIMVLTLHIQQARRQHADSVTEYKTTQQKDQNTHTAEYTHSTNYCSPTSV